MSLNRPLSSYTLLELISIFPAEAEDGLSTGSQHHTTINSESEQSALDAGTTSFQMKIENNHTLWHGQVENSLLESGSCSQQIRNELFHDGITVPENELVDLGAQIWNDTDNLIGFETANNELNKTSNMFDKEQLKLFGNMTSNEQSDASSSILASNKLSKQHENFNREVLEPRRNFDFFCNEQTSPSSITIRNKCSSTFPFTMNEQFRLPAINPDPSTSSVFINDDQFQFFKSLNLNRNEHLVNASTSLIGHSTIDDLPDSRRYCTFCKNNRETSSTWQSHTLRDFGGRVSCPVLRAYVCPRCCGSGDTAHTQSHCPLADPREKNRARYLKRRTSTPSHHVGNKARNA